MPKGKEWVYRIIQNDYGECEDADSSDFVVLELFYPLFSPSLMVRRRHACDSLGRAIDIRLTWESEAESEWKESY